MTTTSTDTKSGGGARVHVQRFGTFLSGMIMPNIAAFIAWGLITAFFIPTGWTPNETVAKMVDPMILYLLPLLIANTGGRMVYGVRGGVIASIATMGVIVGSAIPMFIGAMIVGPLSAWLLKKLDSLWAGKIRPGFEMLVDNFSSGILGAILALGAFFGIAPVVTGFSTMLEGGVNWLVSNNLLPLASIFVEPGKVLFLNNAINHGVFTPLATQEVVENGKSMLYMIESNPGPGLGLLMAFMLVGPKMLRGSIPGIAIIHFFGGIHEVYFPFVLMRPKLIVAMILGGMSGVLTGTIFHTGLTGPPSPGSIFAYFANCPKDGIVGMLLQVTIAAAVTFVVAWFILKTDKVTKAENASFDEEEVHAKATAVVGA